MIYNGTTTDQTGTGTQIQISSFNNSYNNNMYVGYMYTSNQVHGLTNNSTIKGIIDGWYEDNIQGKSAEDLISTEAGFCGDRSIYSGTGLGTSETYYSAYNRLVQNNRKIPDFECSDENGDLYTVDASSKGNHALDYPIGLITADETVYAGSVMGTRNSSFYLYTGQRYWTITPYETYNFAAIIFDIGINGHLDASEVDSYEGVRPVINLNANVTFSTGNGTSSSPYQTG